MGETLKNSQKIFTIGFFAAQRGATSFTSFRTRGGGGGFTQPGYRPQEINISSFLDLGQRGTMQSLVHLSTGGGGGGTQAWTIPAGDKYFFFPKDSVARCRAWSIYPLGRGGGSQAWTTPAGDKYYFFLEDSVAMKQSLVLNLD